MEFGFGKKEFSNSGNLHVYSPGAGTDSPQGSNCFTKGGGGPYVPTHKFSSSFAWLIPSMYQL